MYEEAPGFRPGPRVMTRAQARGDRVVLSIVNVPPQKLQCDEPISNFAFNLNLCRYIMVPILLPQLLVLPLPPLLMLMLLPLVRRCRLNCR